MSVDFFVFEQNIKVKIMILKQREFLENRIWKIILIKNMRWGVGVDLNLYGQRKLDENFKFKFMCLIQKDERRKFFKRI